MKSLKTVLIALFVLSTTLTFGDILPDGCHFVNKYAKITNVENYPDIALIGFTTGAFTSSEIPPYVITADKCLEKGYKYNQFDIYALKRSYLNGRSITDIDYPNDKNVVKANIHVEPWGGYLENSIPIQSIEQYYRIVGFTNAAIVLYKWKEVSKFNNGRADSTVFYNYSEDSTLLSQEIRTAIEPLKYTSTYELYPNPARKRFVLKMDNFYIGVVPVKIFAANGKMIKSFSFVKSQTAVSQLIDVDQLTKGLYFVNIMTGTSVETMKMTINK